MSLRAMLAAAAAALLLAGCAQQSVSNQTDHFSYGGQVSGKTGTERYTWHNTQAKAQVQWGGQSSSGTLAVSISDAAGAKVYERSIQGASQSGNQDATASGNSGDWTITITFAGFTGQMGLNVEASTGSFQCPVQVPYC